MKAAEVAFVCLGLGVQGWSSVLQGAVLTSPWWLGCSQHTCYPMWLQEFEVIAQIKLLQSACNSYGMSPDPSFIRWFQGQRLLTEEER